MLILHAFTLGLLCLAMGDSPQAASPQAASPQAASPQAASPQAASPQAASPQAASPQAASPQAASPQAASPQATSPQATSPQATSPQATSPQATSPQATSPQATSPQATSPQATSPQATSPQATSPQATSPQATSPQATSPQATSPQATSPQATSPQATSPQATSPQATSPQATSPQATSPQARASGDPHSIEHHDVTLCPDDHLLRKGCVTLDQLLYDDLIKSDTTFRFVSSFKMKTNMIIRFEDVSNITLDSAGPHRANISCVGENSGLLFDFISGIAIKNIDFIGCGFSVYIPSISADVNSTIGLLNCSDVALTNVTFKHGTLGSFGVYALNVYGNFTTFNTAFKYMQGTAIGMYNVVPCQPLYQRCFDQSHVMIANSVFESAYCNGASAFAIEMLLEGQSIPGKIKITDVWITNNTHESDVSGIMIVSTGVMPFEVVLERCHYENNNVIAIGEEYYTLHFKTTHLPAADFYLLLTPDEHVNNKHVVKITDSVFINNNFTNREHIDPSVVYQYGVVSFNGINDNLNIFLRNATISNNTGLYNEAIYSNLDCSGTSSFEMRDVHIANSVGYSSIYTKRGSVHFICTKFILIHNSSIVNNVATGLLLEDSHIYFSGNNTLRGNHGYNGGGMAVYGDSSMNISQTENLIFEDNFAQNFGGGLYVKIKNSMYFCYFDAGLLSNVTASLTFSNNSAQTAGNDMYGGNLHDCLYHVNGLALTTGWLVMTDIVRSPDNYNLDVTSDPLHVCDCSMETNQDCIHGVQTINKIKAYPGGLFSLSLIAVGQLLNITSLSGVPTAIYASVLPIHQKPGTIPDEMLVQDSKRHCTELEYRIRSTNINQSEIMVLTTSDNINKMPEYFLTLWQINDSNWFGRTKQLYIDHVTVPAYIEIQLLPCPVGFELIVSKGKCECSRSLVGFVISCLIDTSLIKRKPHTWLKAESGSNSSTLYLTHKHCPFDYCNSSNNFEFSLEEPDVQCNHNRSGILCGECKPGYSLILGRMECKQCTNIYLLLLIPFAFAGILLILLLCLTDMTVAAGTVNGLLFFANIVRENQATFFPPQAAEGFLSVFIAWLNLDFGIGTCFYDGLDSYVFAWLQFLFPIYIWFLTFSIIIASRHVAFMNKVMGHNIVQVLATLFLLSYTKLQRTIVTSLSVTAIDVSNGTKYYVWLVDSNVLYLQGRHIPLFLINSLFLIFLFIPYTFSILLGPWLQAKTHYRVFCWVVKFKPFFDAYFGPLKDKHRYWTGVLLLSRMILSLISAVNVLGDDRVNLLAIITLTFILLVLLWQSGGVYNSWEFLFLDSFYLVNLGLLSTVTLYNKDSSGSQYATICVATGAAFAVFCLTLLYHCLKKLVKCLPFNVSSRQRLLYASLSEYEGGGLTDTESDDDDLKMLKIIDGGRISESSDPKLSLVSVNRTRIPDTY